jgi:class 3 adenylate cyclase
MRRGDLVAAQKAFKQAHELGRDPQPGLALLYLAEGKTDGACACIDQALDEEPRELHRARLLPTQVEVALTTGDLAKANAAAEELDTISQTYGSDALEAAASLARGRIFLAEGNARPAARDVRQALRLWQEIGAPFEVAQSRMLLAFAYLAEGNADSGVLELEAAASAFDRLGAIPDAQRAREKLDSLGIRRTTSDDAEGGDKRTFMFTDIVRSTRLAEAIGDQAWADVVRWHDEALRSLFAEHGGEEIDHAGDGFFVAFIEPAAAVECAVAVQRALSEHRSVHGFAPQVRIGVHTAEAARSGASYRGKGVHEAARIAAMAEGGEVLVSAGTIADSRCRFPVSPARRVELKGVSEPVELVTIDWETESDRALSDGPARTRCKNGEQGPKWTASQPSRTP